MKILYITKHKLIENEITKQLQKKGWIFHEAKTKNQALQDCSTSFYDVIIIDATDNAFPWLETIQELRIGKVFTPILLAYSKRKNENRIEGLKAGSDLCIREPFGYEEFELMVNVLHRRNTEYQAPTISYCGIMISRPDGKICHGETSLSVSPIEIEIFRLLTRATKPISAEKLSRKMNEPKERIHFFAECLQKKIEFLQAPIRLVIKEKKYEFKERNSGIH